MFQNCNLYAAYSPCGCGKFRADMPVERHLILRELTLHPSCEWTPPLYGWTVARVAEGIGYWLQGGNVLELKVGDSLLAGGNAGLVIRASSLGELKLDYFFVHTQLLNGLLTVVEGHQLEQAGRNAATSAFRFGATELVSQKFARLAAQSRPDNLPARSALLQLWAQLVAVMLVTPSAEGQGQKLRERFRRLVAQMTDAEMIMVSLPELAAQLSCSERHFSRLFIEQFGVPLRTLQTELRLQHAQQLLAVADAKIMDVAYESGFRHLGLFNALFKKRFGMTPTELRQQNFPSRPSEPSIAPSRSAATSGGLTANGSAGQVPVYDAGTKHMETVGTVPGPEVGIGGNADNQSEKLAGCQCTGAEHPPRAGDFSDGNQDSQTFKQKNETQNENLVPYNP